MRSSSVTETSGLLLRTASTWVRMVVNSSNVSLTSAMTRRRWVFMLFTAASHNPPKFGARSGMNIPCVEQKLEITPWVVWDSRNSESYLNSREAPTKFVP